MRIRKTSRYPAPVYFQGPFFRSDGWLVAGLMAPVDIQPDNVLRMIAKHSFCARSAVDAAEELHRHT